MRNDRYYHQLAEKKQGKKITSEDIQKLTEEFVAKRGKTITQVPMGQSAFKDLNPLAIMIRDRKLMEEV